MPMAAWAAGAGGRGLTAASADVQALNNMGTANAPPRAVTADMMISRRRRWGIRDAFRRIRCAGTCDSSGRDGRRGGVRVGPQGVKQARQGGNEVTLTRSGPGTRVRKAT